MGATARAGERCIELCVCLLLPFDEWTGLCVCVSVCKFMRAQHVSAGVESILHV